MLTKIIKLVLFKNRCMIISVLKKILFLKSNIQLQNKSCCTVHNLVAAVLWIFIRKKNENEKYLSSQFIFVVANY